MGLRLQFGSNATKATTNWWTTTTKTHKTHMTQGLTAATRGCLRRLIIVPARVKKEAPQSMSISWSLGRK
jgi:hypothetical protein